MVKKWCKHMQSMLCRMPQGFHSGVKPHFPHQKVKWQKHLQKSQNRPSDLVLLTQDRKRLCVVPWGRYASVKNPFLTWERNVVKTCKNLHEWLFDLRHPWKQEYTRGLIKIVHSGERPHFSHQEVKWANVCRKNLQNSKKPPRPQ